MARILPDCLPILWEVNQGVGMRLPDHPAYSGSTNT